MCVLLVAFWFQGVPTSTSRTVTPPAIFAVLLGGVEGEMVRWVIDCRSVTVGRLEFVVLRWPRIGELFFGVGLVALAGKPYPSD